MCARSGSSVLCVILTTSDRVMLRLLFGAALESGPQCLSRTELSMDFALSPEQESFFKTVADFAEAVVAPGAGERDREGRFDRDIWDRVGEQGLCGLPVS